MGCYVSIHPNHANWSSNFVDQNFSLTSHPTNASIRLGHSKLSRVWTAFLNCVLDRILNTLSILLVQHCVKDFRWNFVISWQKTKNSLSFIGPLGFIVGNVPVPCAHQRRI